MPFFTLTAYRRQVKVVQRIEGDTDVGHPFFILRLKVEDVNSFLPKDINLSRI